MVSPLSGGRRDSEAFAAFLAARPVAEAAAAKADVRRSSSTGSLGPRRVSDVTEALSALEKSGALRSLGSGSKGGSVPDPFAAFQRLRPVPKEEPATVEQELREELLRAKRHLLELALHAEQRALDPSEDPAVVTRLRNVKKARSYLRHPELTLEPLSRHDSKGSVSSADAEHAQEAAAEPEAPAEVTRLEASAEVTRLEAAQCEQSPEAGKQLEEEEEEAEALPEMQTLQPSGFAEARSASAPALCADALVTASGGFGRTGFSLPPIGATTMLNFKSHVASRTEPKASKAQAAAVLGGWWRNLRSWNVAILRDELNVRRQRLSMNGGCVVLGNGCIPLYTAMKFPRKGYYWAFQIEAIDNNPSCTNAIALGVSRLPPDDGRCDKLQFGYEIPGSVLVGYGGRVIDAGKWRQVRWNGYDLKRGDVVGFLVNLDGELIVYVNGEQVLRVESSLKQMGILGETLYRVKNMTAEKRRLYPLLDISGRVSAVSLLPGAKPPIVDLGPKDELLTNEASRRLARPGTLEPLEPKRP